MSALAVVICINSLTTVQAKNEALTKEVMENNSNVGTIRAEVERVQKVVLSYCTAATPEDKENTEQSLMRHVRLFPQRRLPLRRILIP